MALDIVKLRALQPPADLGFKIRRLGHVVLQVTDLERSLLFYTQVLGFKVTEIYSEDLQPGGFAFLRCHTDHHSIAGRHRRRAISPCRAASHRFRGWIARRSLQRARAVARTGCHNHL